MRIILIAFLQSVLGDECQDFCLAALGSCGNGSYCKNGSVCHNLFWKSMTEKSDICIHGSPGCLSTYPTVSCLDARSTLLRLNNLKRSAAIRNGPFATVRLPISDPVSPVLPLSRTVSVSTLPTVHVSEITDPVLSSSFMPTVRRPDSVFRSHEVLQTEVGSKVGHDIERKRNEIRLPPSSSSMPTMRRSDFDSSLLASSSSTVRRTDTSSSMPTMRRSDFDSSLLASSSSTVRRTDTSSSMPTMRRPDFDSSLLASSSSTVRRRDIVPEEADEPLSSYVELKPLTPSIPLQYTGTFAPRVTVWFAGNGSGVRKLSLLLDTSFDKTVLEETTDASETRSGYFDKARLTSQLISLPEIPNITKKVSDETIVLESIRLKSAIKNAAGKYVPLVSSAPPVRFDSDVYVGKNMMVHIGAMGVNRISPFVRANPVFTIVPTDNWVAMHEANHFGTMYVGQPELAARFCRPHAPIQTFDAAPSSKWKIAGGSVSATSLSSAPQVFVFHTAATNVYLPATLYNAFFKEITRLFGHSPLGKTSSHVEYANCDFTLSSFPLIVYGLKGWDVLIGPNEYLTKNTKNGSTGCFFNIVSVPAGKDIILGAPVLNRNVIQYDNIAGKISMCNSATMTSSTFTNYAPISV